MKCCTRTTMPFIVPPCPLSYLHVCNFFCVAYTRHHIVHANSANAPSWYHRPMLRRRSLAPALMANIRLGMVAVVVRVFSSCLFMQAGLLRSRLKRLAHTRQGWNILLQMSAQILLRISPRSDPVRLSIDSSSIVHPWRCSTSSASPHAFFTSCSLPVSSVRMI